MLKLSLRLTGQHSVNTQDSEGRAPRILSLAIRCNEWLNSPPERLHCGIRALGFHLLRGRVVLHWSRGCDTEMDICSHRELQPISQVAEATACLDRIAAVNKSCTDGLCFRIPMPMPLLAFTPLPSQWIEGTTSMRYNSRNVKLTAQLHG